MKRHTSVVLIAFVLVGALALWADNKITKKMEMGPMTITETVYIKGARMRTESQNPMGGTTTTIEQCDKKQIIHISDSCKTYFIQPMDEDVKPTPAPKTTSKSTESEPTRKGGVVTITTTMKDLGETKQMFGYTARHIHTTMTMESSPDACNPSNMTMETDGWYAKVGGEAFTCPMRPRVPPNPRAASGGCRDTMRFRSNGSMNPGQPLSLTTTVQGHSFTQETTDLSKATLDASLFEPPAGYTQVSDYAGLQCNSGRPKYVIPNVTRNTTPPDTSDTGDTADTGSTRTKRHGHVRVGVVMPESHVNKDFEAQIWRDKLADDLMQEHIDAVTIDATDRKGIQSEAAEKKCDYILYTDVNEVNAPSGGKKLFGHITGTSSGGYSAKTHLTLMPLNQTDPRLEADAEGKNSGDLNDAGLDAMQSQADQVVEEFQKPWPRPKD